MPALSPEQIEGAKQHLPAVLADPTCALVVRHAGGVATSEIQLWKAALPAISDTPLSDLQIRQLIQRERITRSGQVLELWDASGPPEERSLDLSHLLTALDQLPALRSQNALALKDISPLTVTGERWKNALEALTEEEWSDAKIKALIHQTRTMKSAPVEELMPWHQRIFVLSGILGILAVVAGITYGLVAWTGLPGLVMGVAFWMMLFCRGRR